MIDIAKVRKARAKRLMKRPAGRLTLIAHDPNTSPPGMTRAFTNNRYVVTVYDQTLMTDGTFAKKAMIQRLDNSPIPNHWREMQAIKNSIFGKDSVAVEYYPAESRLIDDFNIYWMFVLPSMAEQSTNAG